MYYQDLNEGGHKWEKLNLVTLRSNNRKGGYDQMKCEHCGMLGKVRQLGHIDIPERYKKANVKNCPKAPKVEIKPITNDSFVKVKICTAFGSQFKNLTPGSVHKIVEPPAPYDRKKGEWVMGVGEPVMLLFSEFEYLKHENT